MPLPGWQRIETIYRAALNRRPDERAAYLDQACAGDDEIRREVEALLAQDTPRVAMADHWASYGRERSTTAATATVLMPGMQIGPYRIEGQIGKGGMGEVFRAIDTRLGRQVAIKTSQERFGERFEREARAISALNHPHICTLYDVGATPSGTSYLVMELVEGESLAERLKRGKLSFSETLKYGQQIADALAAAHARGIIHRDLKPHNIMLAKSGVKVLDFGLAKSAQDATLTASRAVMGTPAYMAPEQFEGKDADSRSDIYSLGLVLREMATGRRDPPSQIVLMAQLPEQLTHVIEGCLAHDPEERWQSAKDIQAELQWTARRPNKDQAATPPQRPWIWGAAGVVFAVFAGAIGIAFFSRVPVARQPVRFRLVVDHGTADLNSQPSPSPDGSAIVYSARASSGELLLWLRLLDEEDAKPLAGTDDAIRPFWSPDGKWIGFFAQGRLKKVSREGGAPQIIASLTDFDSAAWGAGGQILLNLGNRTPLYRIADSGGELRQVTKLDVTRGENSHRFVRFLPDGRRFLFLARSSDRRNNSLYMGSLDSGEYRRIAAMQSNVAYIPSRGNRPPALLFVRDGTMYSQPMNDARLVGQPIVVIKEVAYNPISIESPFDVSMNGSMLVYHPAVDERQQLEWFNRTGLPVGSLGPPGVYNQVRISPNGKEVLFNRPDDNGGNRDLWLMNTLRGTTSRLTLNEANEWSQIWSPDGTKIVFASDRTGGAAGNMYQKVSMEPGVGETSVSGVSGSAIPQDWSADGRWIAFGSQGNIRILPTFGDRKPFAFVDTVFSERESRFSPDGKWIAYYSNETGRFEVYIRSFNGGPGGSSRKIQISEKGGFYPVWRGEGSELFFVGADSVLYSVSTKAANSMETVPKPTPLFVVCPGNTPFGAATQGTNYDVTRDGQRFLFSCGSDALGRFSVIVN
jgi:serine/threonine protein kinase/Tol biopolymer transport system component